ncbi:MAG TPA: terminase family protein [Candidatus Bipolaricaulis sp.]|nr:terminase family protein [Candidatus Bipolaricaulis sp.]
MRPVSKSAISYAKSHPKLRAQILKLSDRDLGILAYDWELNARPEQLMPPGNWFIWLILTGRGWGKTRAGSESVCYEKRAGRARRIALVGATAADVRDVMVDGPSGIMAVSPPWDRPEYQPSKRRLRWADGAIAYLYSADEPDRLRGPQHDFAFCDEIAAWRYPDAWDNLLLGMRMGEHPRIVATTTPKPRAFLRAIMEDPRSVVTRGSTYDNRENLPEAFFSHVIARYEGTTLGRQEIEGEFLEDIPGALLTRATIDALRVQAAPSLLRIVIAVDPAATAHEESDETGIVACGIAENGHVYCIADESGRYTPVAWGKRVLALAARLDADAVVAEVNQGGDMVGTILALCAEELGVPMPRLVTVHAKRGKVLRAEPVVAMYEQGRIHHVGSYHELEDQLCGWTVDADWSPDRMDALVYAITELSGGENEIRIGAA